MTHTYNSSTLIRMPKITRQNCKAPSYEDFPKLSKVRADTLLMEAREIKAQQRVLETRLRELAPRIKAKLDVALGDDANSVVYEDLLVSRRGSYTKRTFDTKWAIKKLIAKGVKKAEIDEHTKETEVEATISMQLLEDDDGVVDGDDE